MSLLQRYHSRNLGLSQIIFPFLLGFLSISMQILLLREFLVQFYGNEVIYGFVLGFWLLWGSIGSLLASKFRLQKKHVPLLFEITIFLSIFVFIGLRFIRFFWGKPFGESLGVGSSFLTAFGCCFLLSFPFGLLFFLNVLFLGGDLTRVYLLESLGACLAGLTVDLGLIPLFTCWQSLAILGIFCLFLLSLFSSNKINLFVLASITIALIMLIVFDFQAQKIAVRPFPLIKSHDSPFGRWQIIKIDEQITLYQDGLATASIPDPAEAEEITHFALLQRPESKKVLLVGGGFSGAIEEVLRYPLTTLDYVEIDPDIIPLIRGLLSPEKGVFFESPRLRIHHLDGRTFLQKTKEFFDVVIIAVPEPATAQLNRFYSREFYSLIKNHLSPDGVVSLRVSSAENYQSLSLTRYLKNIYSTFSSVFSNVEIIPGDTNIFLASDGQLTIDPEFFVTNLKKYQIETRIIRSQILSARLSPMRVEKLKSRISSSISSLNSDLQPKGYLYFLIYWASQFGLTEAKILEFFTQIPQIILILLPLLLILAIFLPVFSFKGKAALPGLPLIVLGFTSLMAEVLILLWFQIRFGYIYEKIALLIACFMFGLFAGALISQKFSSTETKTILADQALIIAILVFLLILLPVKIASFVPYLFLFLLGTAGGHLFVISNQPMIREGQSYGLGYGLDLAGSFLGAILGPLLFFPLLGLPKSIISLLILNLGCLLFLFFCPSGRNFKGRFPTR